MSVAEGPDVQEGSGAASDCDSGNLSSKMYRRLVVQSLPDCKHPSLLPLVNIDKENYMLRGVSRPGSSEVEFDGFMVCEINHSLTAASAVTGAGGGGLGDVAAAAPADGTTVSCARILSFHPLMCSCEMSCCCMCGSFCSTDCSACFHEMCARLASSHVCLKGEEAPATGAVQEIDKVSRPLAVYHTFTLLHFFPISITMYKCRGRLNVVVSSTYISPFQLSDITRLLSSAQVLK